MSKYDFEEDYSDSDDGGFCFFDNINQVKQVETRQNEQDSNLDDTYFRKNLTQVKEKSGDYNTIQINSDYEIKKTWLNDLEKELDDLLSQIKKNSTISKNADSIGDKSNNEDRTYKKQQEIYYKKIEAKLFNVFNYSKDPFWLNLFLIENSKDYKLNKYNTLFMLINKSFEKWASISSANDSKHIKDYNFSNDIKIWAFIIATQHHLFLIDSIAKTYKLNIYNEFLMPYLQKRLTQKNDYKDKALMIAALNLQDKFDLEKTLCPLLLQDKINVIEKYLATNKNQQKLFVEYLDMMCSEEKSLYEYTYKFSIPEIKIEKLNQKYLSKLAVRLMKTYKIDPSSCPNVTNQKYHKNLKYLIYRRYIECSITYEPWQDLVMECLKQADYLIEHFLLMLDENNDYKEMYKWIKLLNVNFSELPSYIQNRILELKDSTQENDDFRRNAEDEKILDNYYQLKLEENNIKIIENKNQLFDLLDYILEKQENENHIFVGVDAEWKPTCATAHYGDESKMVALVQVATLDRVYLIDMIKLYDVMDVKDFQSFSKSFFCNKKIIKIGYGFTHDIKILCKSFYNTIEDHDMFRQSVLDLAYLVSHLLEINVKLFQIFPNIPKTNIDEDLSKEKEEKGLSELIKLCFAKPLNKSEQISNWEKRPLRKSQINYAALDAYCLIEIFYFIENRLKELNLYNIDLTKFVGRKYKHPVSIGQLLKKDNNDKKSEVLNESIKIQQISEVKKFEDLDIVINENPIKPQDLRVVCDNMLGGLGKELRRCGVDAIILENEKDHTEVARICRRENRFALTAGLPYFAIRAQLPEGRCIHVKVANAKEQCSHVLKLFNVQVKLSDLFSRCRKCNTSSYAVFSKNQIKFLWFLHKDRSKSLETVDINYNNKKFNDPKRIPIRETNYDPFADTDLLGKVCLDTFYLKNSENVRILVENIFDTTIEVVETYYVCCGCGHVYWEGPHWQTLEQRFSHVLNKT